MEQSLYHYVTDAVKVWSGFISACLWLLLMNDWMNFLLTLRHAKQPIRECRKAACVCVCVFVWLRVLLTTEGQVVLTLNTDSLMSVLLSAEAAGWTCAEFLWVWPEVKQKVLVTLTQIALTTPRSSVYDLSIAALHSGLSVFLRVCRPVKSLI